MLQPEFKKQTLKINVNPSLNGAKKGSLSNCKMEYNAFLGTRFLCKSSIDLVTLKTTSAKELEVVCEKPYKGESLSYGGFLGASISNNWMSVGPCFASGSKSVTIKAAKK